MDIPPGAFANAEAAATLVRARLAALEAQPAAFRTVLAVVLQLAIGFVGALFAGVPVGSAMLGAGVSIGAAFVVVQLPPLRAAWRAGERLRAACVFGRLAGYPVAATLVVGLIAIRL